MPKILVLGLGNMLLKDDGVGCHVAQELAQLPLPPPVEVLDAGTTLFDFYRQIEQADYVIFIDAVKMGHEPGTIYRLYAEDLAIKPAEINFSLHQLDVITAVHILQQIGFNRPLVIIGVEPKEISWATELSLEVQEQLPRVMETIMAEINRYLGGS